MKTFLPSSRNIPRPNVFSFLNAFSTSGYVHSFVYVASPSSSSADNESSENITGGGGFERFRLLWTGFLGLGGSSPPSLAYLLRVFEALGEAKKSVAFHFRPPRKTKQNISWFMANMASPINAFLCLTKAAYVSPFMKWVCCPKWGHKQPPWWSTRNAEFSWFFASSRFAIP